MTEKHTLTCENCYKVFGYYYHTYIEPIDNMIPPPTWVCKECCDDGWGVHDSTTISHIKVEAK